MRARQSEEEGFSEDSIAAQPAETRRRDSPRILSLGTVRDKPGDSASADSNTKRPNTI